MKILHVIPTLSAGGAETFASDLAAQQQLNIKNEVAIFLIGGVRDSRGEFLKEKLLISGVEVYGAKYSNMRSFVSLWRLIYFFWKNKFDIIHVHLYAAEVFVLVAAFFQPLIFLKSKFVRTIHSVNIFGNRSIAISKITTKLFRENICCSEVVMRSYELCYGAGNSVLVNNGVSFAPELDVYFDIRSKLNIPCGANIILCVGAFRGPSLKESAKAQDIAIKSFDIFFADSPNSYLVFLGGGGLIIEAKEMANNFSSRDNIIFAGMVDSVQIILKQCDLLFMPSRFEGLPIVGLEAGCSGLPVLAANIPELKSIGKIGAWIFPEKNSEADFASMLSYFFKEKHTLTKISRNISISFLSEFGIEACANNYQTVYEKVFQGMR